MKLSVCIITKDEEARLAQCLGSVMWADEVVVVDSGSTDRTVEIARERGCVVVETPWLGFGPTKQLAVESAAYDWVLSLDADEEVSDALRAKVAEMLEGELDCTAYRIRRCSWFMGRLIKYSGWRRDAPIRLFDRRHCSFNNKPVHESVQCNAPLGYIREPIMHHAYPRVERQIAKINSYSSLGAEERYQQGKRATLPGAVLRGMAKFLNHYVVHAGFLDGKEGLVMAINSGFYAYLKQVKLWELHRLGPNDDTDAAGDDS